MAKLLVNAGADVNTRSKEGTLALGFAVNKDPELYKYLLKKIQAKRNQALDEESSYDYESDLSEDESSYESGSESSSDESGSEGRKFEELARLLAKLNSAQRDLQKLLASDKESSSGSGSDTSEDDSSYDYGSES